MYCESYTGLNMSVFKGFQTIHGTTAKNGKK